MSELVVQRPWNLLGAGQAKYVDGDVFNIASRLGDVDGRLRLVLHETHEKPWVVIELCGDGEERLVKRYAELDARIIEDVMRMRAIPFEERLRKLEIEERRAAEEAGKADPERMERLAWEMHRAMVADNMINPGWTRVHMGGGRKKS